MKVENKNTGLVILVILLVVLVVALSGYTVYDKVFSENNNEIMEKFNELKTSANDTATKIKSLYDGAIQEAIQKL